VEPLTDKTDEEIVARARQNKEHFGVLVSRYEAPLFRYVKRLGVRTDEDAYDILQEVFLKAYRYINEFDTSLSFSSWIYRITHNETVSWFRKRSVRPEGHLLFDSEPTLSFAASDRESSDALFDKSRDADVLEEAMQTLDQKYRDVLILRFFEHKEYEEISDILRIPVGSVGTLIHRAKKRLRTAIDTRRLSSHS